MMYLVSVKDIQSGRRLDLVRFTFGSWEEIGFWLDEMGYGEIGKHRVTVSFVRENEFSTVKVVR